MTENIEVFINNSIRIRDRVGTIYIDPYEVKARFLLSLRGWMGRPAAFPEKCVRL